MASSKSENSTMVLDKGSPVEHHPINGFSHLKKENGKWVKRIKLSFPELSLLSRQSSLPYLSQASNSMRHFLVALVPLCIAFLAGMKILTRRCLIWSSGTMLRWVTSSWTAPDKGSENRIMIRTGTMGWQIWLARPFCRVGHLKKTHFFQFFEKNPQI